MVPSSFMPTIKFENVTAKYYDQKGNESIVFKCLNNIFEDGSFNVILGPSGCGKTTLLRTLFDGVEYDGLITFDGKDIEKVNIQKRYISYLSQDYALYPHLTIFENIAFPLRVLRAPMEEVKRRVNELAKELDIEMCLTRKPRHISGGQQQRVALARSLIKNPCVCLLDEPFSNLDKETAQKSKLMLKNVLKERNITTLYVTHDVGEATSLADCIYVMNNGTFVFQGTPEEFIHSTNSYVVSLLKASECRL